MENLVYKILTEEQWKTASKTGLIEVELDKKDKLTKDLINPLYSS